MDKKNQNPVLIWLTIMTFSAGYMNAVALLGLTFTVSHHTGNVSQFAIAIWSGKLELALVYLAAIAFFFVGATSAGCLFFHCEIGKSKRYGFLMVVLGLLYGLLALVLPDSLDIIVFLFTALSLGMQNGILTHYRGITTRITHMTGYLTDAGVEFGEWLRGKRGHVWRSGFFLTNVMIFAFGSLIGAVLFPYLGRQTMILAGVLQICCGLLYIFKIVRLYDPLK